MRMFGKGQCFGLNYHTEEIPKQIAFNLLSIACSFPKGWSIEKHQFMGIETKNKILTLLVCFQVSKKHSSFPTPPKPIQLSILKLL